MNKQVVYPSWGLSYLVNSPLDLLEDRLDNKDIIQFRVASQPNSNPHFGTITTMFATFALAAYSKEYLNKDSYVFFECLTNSPDYSTKKEIENTISYKNLEKSKHLFTFTKLLEFAKGFSEVNYVQQTYHDFIKDVNIRSYLLDITQQDNLLDLIQPNDNSWHLRTPCPKCGYTQKEYSNVKLKLLADSINITSLCSEHGEYTQKFTVDNNTFIEVNTQLRTLLKGKLTSEIETNTHILPVWVDGADWSGEWSIRMFAESLNKLGIHNLPRRLFTPCILDWSGAKFSKSLYINNPEYINQYESFVSLNNLIESYGENKLEDIYNECYSWVVDSSKFFRNYTIDYFKHKLSL